MQEALDALQKYSQQFYSTIDFTGDNVVLSPVGSWLFIASIANSLDYTDNPSLKEGIESVLHLSVEEAEIAAQKLIEEYPALNYVAKTWTSSSLSDLPAVQKWVERNTQIPHEDSIPSQKVIDAWVAENTNDLIKSFPSDLNDSTVLIIANIIYSKLTWKTKFDVVPSEGSMKSWDVENVLKAEVGREFSICEDENNDFFAVVDVRAASRNRERVSLITCLNRTMEPAQLLEAMDNLGEMECWEPDSEFLLSLNPDMFRFKENRVGSGSDVIDVQVPAWEASSKHHLLGTNVLGYEEVVESFKVGAKIELEVEASQVAVAKFDAEGFEAAALTSVTVLRCAVPVSREKRVYELNFCKPFAFVSYTGNVPVFSGFITTAKDGK